MRSEAVTCEMQGDEQNGERQTDDGQNFHPPRHGDSRLVPTRFRLVVRHPPTRSVGLQHDLSEQNVLIKTKCLSYRQIVHAAYIAAVPRLWNDTIETHRRAVRDAILDAAWSLVSRQGLASVTMSQIAQDAGIGRATLYKYFPDVEAILSEWHLRHVADHLARLKAVRDGDGRPRARLEAVLETYGQIAHRRGRHNSELVSLLHKGQPVEGAHQELAHLVRDLLAECVTSGEVRSDVPPAELAAYCLHALEAAAGLASDDAVRRLVDIVLGGLRPSDVCV
jgi:AcrR family transcriptional regulator